MAEVKRRHFVHVLALEVDPLWRRRSPEDRRVDADALRAAADDTQKLTVESKRLNVALQKLGAANPEGTELARWRQRAAVLTARPPGVTDEAMISAASWRNVGRATPEEANLTFHWAMFTRDLATVSKFVLFDDDTPENRAAFMAHFSPAVRAKYSTPEQIMAAAAYGAGTSLAQSANDAFQPLGVDEHVGGNGSRYGQKRVRVWYRLASGKEFEGSTRWQQTPEGWAPAGPMAAVARISASNMRFRMAFSFALWLWPSHGHDSCPLQQTGLWHKANARTDWRSGRPA